MSLSLKTIDQCIGALIANAEELVSEAKLLWEAKAYARAHALAHFAREEISKCVVLHAAAVRTLAGVEVDWKRTMARLRSHKAKLRMETVQNAIFVASVGQQDLSDQIIQTVDDQVDYRDDRKNTALYVGIDEGKITRPSESVTAAQAHRTIKLAELALDMEKRICKAMGPLADRKPGSLAHLKEAIPVDAKDIAERLKNITGKYQEVLKKLYEEKGY